GEDDRPVSKNTFPETLNTSVSLSNGNSSVTPFFFKQYSLTSSRLSMV
ncbi:MAG: hypothetical protein H7Y00_08605, partial [Fimbriimonadaceae bacterium]|nr:hypothetical protein [Chitinophagales bacterium]